MSRSRPIYAMSACPLQNIPCAHLELDELSNDHYNVNISAVHYMFKMNKGGCNMHPSKQRSESAVQDARTDVTREDYTPENDICDEAKSLIVVWQDSNCFSPSSSNAVANKPCIFMPSEEPCSQEPPRRFQRAGRK